MIDKTMSGLIRERNRKRTEKRREQEKRKKNFANPDPESVAGGLSVCCVI